MNEQKSKEQQIYEALSAPFTVTGADGVTYPALKWKMQTKQGLCVPYLDSRQVSQRLNEAIGVNSWSSVIEETQGEYIIYSLTLNINGVETTKTDVGTPSEYAKDKGKASDGLKRAAVHFGVGRYIYEMEGVQLNTKMHGNKKVPCTADGTPLPDEKSLSSYINQKHPLRAKLTEVYNALKDEDKKKLQNQFAEIWNAIASSNS